MSVQIRVDSERGCGWRKEGGIYLVSGNAFTGCERMPLRLDRCPTCDHGVKPARGWQWVDFDALFANQPCRCGPATTNAHPLQCAICGNCVHRARPCPNCKHDTPHDNQEVYCSEECDCDRTDVEGWWKPGVGRVGLLWVGEQFYKTPKMFSEEAARLGISRRLPRNQVPREFVAGETIVLMAHRKAIQNTFKGTTSELCADDEPDYFPGVFMVFRPTGLEYVVKGDETDEELEAIENRGIQPVRVQRLEKQTSMFDEPAPVC